MRRSTAKLMHQATNIAFWIENPEWSTDNAVADFARRGLYPLPFKIHDVLKELFFDTDKVAAVNGETVVTYNNGNDTVDKFMLRYPGKMPLETFRAKVTSEIGTVTHYLAGVALPTQVSIKNARVFRSRDAAVPAVTQTQQRVDLAANPVLDLEIAQAAPSKLRDQTAINLEQLVNGAGWLAEDYGYYPDTANSGGNLRRNILDGSVVLIDVMPFYANGSRLVGDRPPNVIEHVTENLESYRDFVGQFGG